jgi:DNA end-binding protein Ku
MPQRPIWRGHLRLALVSCPVALYSANHERGSLHFNLINPDTGNRVRMITQDAETGAELQRRDLVKGYEFKKDTYLIMNDEDFESARVESSSTIKIEKFVDGDTIDPIRFESSYYLAPDGDAGTDVYVVLRDAIAATGKSALARVVIARRERAIAIMPLANGLVAHTLHEDRELNDYGELFANLPGSKPDPEMIALAKQLIGRQSGRYQPGDFEDRYEARLREVIDAKLKGEGIDPVGEEEDRGNVIDLMAALKQSLGGEAKAGKARPAAKPAPAAKKPAAKTSAAAAKKPAAAAGKPARKRA